MYIAGSFCWIVSEEVSDNFALEDLQFLKICLEGCVPYQNNICEFGVKHIKKYLALSLF